MKKTKNTMRKTRKKEKKIIKKKTMLDRYDKSSPVTRKMLYKCEDILSFY
jgi:hypothetical protein